MKGRGGLILNIGSAAGLYPMQFGPIYSASKGLSTLFQFPNHVIQTTSRSNFLTKSEKENDITNSSSVWILAFTTHCSTNFLLSLANYHHVE